MRDILFRGLRTDGGGWAYGFLVKHPQRIGYTGDSPWWIHVPPADPDDDGGIYNVAPETVGQYTGVYDMNGVRVFEGDVVDHCCGVRYAVSWVDQYSRFAGTKKGVVAAIFSFRSCKVVGNIHEAPELMPDAGKSAGEYADNPILMPAT